MRYRIAVFGRDISVISDKNVPDTLCTGKDFDYILEDIETRKAYIVPRGEVIEIMPIEEAQGSAGGREE